MAGADLKFIFAIAIIGVLWISFNTLFYLDKLEETSGLPGKNNESGIFDSLSFDFLDVLTAMFTSESYIINVFVFGILLFGIIIVGYRQLRSGA